MNNEVKFDRVFDSFFPKANAAIEKVDTVQKLNRLTFRELFDIECDLDLMISDFWGFSGCASSQPTGTITVETLKRLSKCFEIMGAVARHHSRVVERKAHALRDRTPDFLEWMNAEDTQAAIKRAN